MFYAHSVPGDESRATWQPLECHLQAVSRLAQQFSAAFDSSDWGRLAGLWHDLGKYRPEFQDRLSGDPSHVDHAVVGALLATTGYDRSGTSVLGRRVK
jgi:CRISPR-associated endonuclease/helicase Cas3